MNNILNNLKQRQGNLSDTAFAKNLGLSRTLWRQIKVGERKVSITLLRALTRTYPELDQEILAFLKDSNHD
jgi:hypothetical protein